MAGGRPTKLTPSLKSRLLLLLADGNYRGVAASACGIDYATFCRWMNDPRPPFRALRADCERAEAQAELDLTGIVRRAANGDPKLALEFLSRRYPERWAAASKVDIETMLRREAASLAAEFDLDPNELVNEAMEILQRNA